MKRVSLVLIHSSLLVVLCLFNQCGDVSFSQPQESVQGSGLPTDPQVQIYTATQSVTASAKPLDIVWLSDNSGSMNAEAAHVRNNFLAFATRLAQVPDVRLTLISTIGTGGNSVSMPVNSPITYQEINRLVNSRDGLQILSHAICPMAMQGNACDTLTGNFPPVRGTAANFFRANAHKVVIMVSDDDSIIPFTDFHSLFQSVYPNQGLTFFGFVGQGAALSPCQARTGQQYINYAQATGGAVYNICDMDWTATFNQLASNVVTIGLGAIPLPPAILGGTIKKVEINGQVIAPANYTITGGGIQFNASVYQNLTQVNLRIEYTVP